MALTLDTFRQIGTGDVMISGGGDGLREATFGHKFRTFFNIGTARAENRQLLESLKSALLREPRFYAVHDQIDALVRSIRTDRAIGAAQIRSVLDRLDALTTPEESQRLFRERIDAHLAMRTVPSGAGERPQVPDLFANQPDLYARLAKTYVLGKFPGRDAAMYAQRDIAAELDEFDAISSLTLTLCGDDADLQDLVKTMADALLRTSASDIRTPKQIKERVDGFRANLQEARAFTATLGPGVIDDVKLFLAGVAKPVAAGVVTQILNSSSPQLVTQIGGLDLARGKGSVSDVHEAVRQITLACAENRRLVTRDDPAAALSADALFVQGMLRKLDAGSRRRLLDFLTGPDGIALGRAYASADIASSLSRMSSTFVLVTDELCRLEDAHRVLPENRTEPLENAEDIGLSPAQVYELSPELLSPDLRVREELARFPDENLFSTADRQSFAQISEHRRKAGVPDATILEEFRRSDSAQSRLLAFLGLSVKQEDFYYGVMLLDGIDAIFAPPLVARPAEPVQPGQIDGKYAAFVKEMLLEEISEMPAGQRPQLPNLSEWVQSHPVVQAVCRRPAPAGQEAWDGVLGQSELAVRLRQMTPVQRRAYTSLTITFDFSSDVRLAQLFSTHLDAFVSLYETEGLVTRAAAHRIITGERELPPELASDRTGGDVKSYYFNKEFKVLSQALADGQLTMDQYSPAGALVMDRGLMAHEAIEAVRTGIVPEAKVDPFRPHVVPPACGSLESVERNVAGDINRFTGGYSIDGRPVEGIAPGGTYDFRDPARGMSTVVRPHQDIERGGDEQDRTAFDNGHLSSVSRRMRENVVTLCGARHPEQARMVLIALGQGALAPLRGFASLYGVTANEHSQAVWTIERRANGDVSVTVTQPENCPLEFKWTLVFSPDGKQRMEGEPMMRRVER